MELDPKDLLPYPLSTAVLYFAYWVAKNLIGHAAREFRRSRGLARRNHQHVMQRLDQLGCRYEPPVCKAPAPAEQPEPLIVDQSRLAS